MFITNKTWILTGALSCLIASVTQFVLDFWLTIHYPGYHWLSDSVSYLGQESSPFKPVLAVWGVVFSILEVLFAIGFYKAFWEKGRWATVAACMIALYGLGEGMGSGFFPVNPDVMTRSTFYHELFSVVGDSGMILLPFVLLKIFPRKLHPRFFSLFLFTIIGGLSLSTFFVIAKVHPLHTGIWTLKGVAQRLYIFVYHFYQVGVAWKMAQAAEGFGVKRPVGFE